MVNIELTQELVKFLFDYKDGFLLYKKSKIKKYNGCKAGYWDSYTEYYKIRVNGKSYLTHRLIFFWHYGYFPEIVDHGDRDVKNNKIENLRAADIWQNNVNRKSSYRSNSIYLGVGITTNGTGKWTATVRPRGCKQLYLGVFITQEEAALAYNKAAVKHYGEFANLNIIKPTHDPNIVG